MLTVAMPAQVSGEQLRIEIEAALGQAVRLVHDPLTGLQVHGADESARTKVESVIAQHVPVPDVEPSEDLADRIRAVHDDPQVSASVKKLAAALLGLGSDSAVAGRPTDR